jgi:peptidyl-prolyl cis-trans isomerase B (cyclophilin B)
MPSAPQQFDEVPDQTLAEGSVWTATVTTNCGDIVMELDGTKAPQTVASFLHLAREGYWDSSPCHRLVPSGIFVLQCGDPTGTGSGNPGYGFGVENAPEDASYPRGTLAMARTTDPETNGGQFFIVYDDSQIPDNGGTGYTIFGKVTEGMDIVDRIAESGVGGTLGPEAPVQPISIVDIEVAKA